MNLRLYCRYGCPLGWMQSAVRLWRGPRRVCTRLPETKAQRIVRWTLFAIYALSFFLPALYIVKPFLDPYAIVCRAVAYTFFSPEADAIIAALAYVPLVMVLVISLVSRGRFWCNWICPWGTALHQASKVLSKGDVVGRGCGKCRKCMEKK